MLEQRHVITAVRRDDSRLHSRRAATDDGDFFVAGGRDDHLIYLVLQTDHRVDGANAVPRTIQIDNMTFVAADTGSHIFRTSLIGKAAEIGIADPAARHTD